MSIFRHVFHNFFQHLKFECCPFKYIFCLLYFSSLNDLMASDWSIRTKGSLFVNEPTPNINEKSIPAHSSDLIIYPELDFLGGI